jgi:hypothetical protein
MSKPQKGTNRARVTIWFAPFFFLLCFFVASAQPEELWRVRAQTITDDLLKDAAQLTPLRRAVLWARLAQHWWQSDQDRARTWLRNAVEIVEQVPNKENPYDRRDRLSTARLLVNISAPLDKKLTTRLLATLNNAEEQWTEIDRTTYADALMNVAITYVDRDPRQAAELVSQSLRLGPPSDIGSLLLAMRKRDPKLADALFTQALSLATQNLSVGVLSSLTYAAFPERRGVGDTEFIPPEQFRSELLQIDVAYLNANPITDENRNPICASIAGFIAPVLSEFDRLVPQQASVVRQAINKCRSVSPLVQQHLDMSLKSAQLDTVADLLKAAADSEDLTVRTVYESRAANLAQANKEYERALKILDGMSKESRELMGETWESYRWDWAAAGALEHYKAGRLLEMNLILNAVPADLQPLAKATFVDRLPTQRDPEGDPALQFLNDARAGLRKSNVRESEKAGCYFVLLRSVIKYDRPTASAVIKEAFASLNRMDQATPNKDRRMLESSEFLHLFPASLLEVDEFAVREGIASMTTIETRAQIRFALLGSTIERMQPPKR